MKDIKRFGAWCLAGVLVTSQGFAQTRSDFSFYTDVREPSLTAEYLHRMSPKDRLISIQVLGAVKNPGVYYVPEDTDLTKLLSLTGGHRDESDLDSVVVRKRDPKLWAQVESNYIEKNKGGAYEIELARLLKYESSGTELKLSNQDLVFVPEKKSWISQDLSRAVTVTSVLLTAVLTGLIISSQYELK